MIRCIKCNRRMKRETETGMGRVCALAAYGRKERKQASEVKRDDLTRDLFPMHAVSAFGVEHGL